MDSSAGHALGGFGFRWLHILAGITWIGLLYYFNLVQVPAFAAYGDEARARNIAIDKVARRALWWFRWAAISTFVTGILIASSRRTTSPTSSASRPAASGSAPACCWARS